MSFRPSRSAIITFSVRFADQYEWERIQRVRSNVFHRVGQCQCEHAWPRPCLGRPWLGLLTVDAVEQRARGREGDVRRERICCVHLLLQLALRQRQRGAECLLLINACSCLRPLSSSVWQARRRAQRTTQVATRELSSRSHKTGPPSPRYLLGRLSRPAGKSFAHRTQREEPQALYPSPCASTANTCTQAVSGAVRCAKNGCVVVHCSCPRGCGFGMQYMEC